MAVATLAILPTLRQRQDLQERMARCPTRKCRAPHSRSARTTWCAGSRLFRAVRLSASASSGRPRCRAMRSSRLPRAGATGRRSIGPAAARLPCQTDLLPRPSSRTGHARDVRQRQLAGCDGVVVLVHASENKHQAAHEADRRWLKSRGVHRARRCEALGRAATGGQLPGDKQGAQGCSGQLSWPFGSFMIS
jgi:hypothetical protein